MKNINHDQLINEILDQARSGEDLTPEQGLILLEQTDINIIDNIRETADILREKSIGETVTYVVNRNINFTNICEQHCSFCAFRRDQGEEGAFWLDLGQILEKAGEAVAKGATEICMQGGLNPEAKFQGTSLGYYLNLIKSLKQEFPQLHLHAFSPQEIQFIAREDDLSYEEVIISLQEAGVGSMPGTAAEILDDQVRKIICPEKINRATWLEIVTTAHRLGMPTTSTMLSGHIETHQQQIDHLDQLRSLQKNAIQNNYPAQITEFIILPFVGENAPAFLRHKVGKDQPNLGKTLHLTAVARIFLNNWIINHQPSWVKLGLNGATEALKWGCNDLGGTLMEEHITTMAGAKGGSFMEVETLQNAIKSLGRSYRQRTTLYSDCETFSCLLPLASVN
jgi:5-amino-6-(D-ribitylamino)uracil---L-tyrosine 4-hydroxyphenyl transferase